MVSICACEDGLREQTQKMEKELVLVHLFSA